MTAAFPALPLPLALRFIRLLGFEFVDLQCFAGEPHIEPGDILAAPDQMADRIRSLITTEALSCADVFATMPDRRAVNTPSKAEHEQNVAATDAFARFAKMLGSPGLTILPGIVPEGDTQEASFARSVGALKDHVAAASRHRIACAFEPHIGSVAARPEAALGLCDAVPGLSINFDPSHFIVQGDALSDLVPLMRRTTRVQVRQATPTHVQAGSHDGVIDVAELVRLLAAAGFYGGICIEYIHKPWEDCRNVDVVTETVLMREALDNALKAGGPRERL